MDCCANKASQYSKARMGSKAMLGEDVGVHLGSELDNETAFIVGNLNGNIIRKKKENRNYD